MVLAVDKMLNEKCLEICAKMQKLQNFFEHNRFWQNVCIDKSNTNLQSWQYLKMKHNGNANCNCYNKYQTRDGLLHVLLNVAESWNGILKKGRENLLNQSNISHQISLIVKYLPNDDQCVG